MKIYGIKMLKNQKIRLKNGIKTSSIKSNVYFSIKNPPKTIKNQSAPFEFSVFL
jgi:hypothetical protein